MIARHVDYAILDSPVRNAWIEAGAREAGMAADRIIKTASLAEAMEKLKEIPGNSKVVLFENDLPDNLD